MTTLDELKATVDRLEGELQAAREAYNAVLVAGHEYKVGQTLVNKKGVRAQVSAVVVEYGNPRPYIRQFLKSGALGTRDRRAYSWDGWEIQS